MIELLELEQAEQLRKDTCWETNKIHVSTPLSRIKNIKILKIIKEDGTEPTREDNNYYKQVFQKVHQSFKKMKVSTSLISNNYISQRYL